MTIMLGAIFVCLALGLWAPKRRQVRWVVGAVVVLMVIVFFVSPHRL